MTDVPDAPVGTLQIVPTSPFFDSAVTIRAVHEFGVDGAWLLMSTIRYGWRAYYDLGRALALAENPIGSEPPIDGSIAAEFDVGRMLQVQGLVYSAAEQLATLILAARKHRSGADAFFRAYTGNVNVVKAVKKLTKIGRTELAELLGVDKFDEYATWITDANNRDPVHIGPLTLDRADVTSEFVELFRLRAHSMLDTFATNFEELQVLVVPPESNDKDAPPAQSLRVLDNSFRHGLRVMFHSASPVEHHFRVLGDNPGDAVASVYLPSSGGTIEYGGIETSQDSILSMLNVLRWLAVRIWQFAYAFLGAKTTGSAGPAVDATFHMIGDPPT